MVIRNTMLLQHTHTFTLYFTSDLLFYILLFATHITAYLITKVQNSIPTLSFLFFYIYERSNSKRLRQLLFFLINTMAKYKVELYALDIHE